MTRLGTLAVAMVGGIGIGVGGILASERLQAQQRQDLQQIVANPPEVRLITIPAPRGQARREGFGSQERLVQPPPGLVFLKDVKTDGCWLASLGDRDETVALAVAPADACR
jgi:hypothetical protein